MTWTKIPEDWNDVTEDVMQLSNDAELLHIRVMVHCNRILSDGLIRDVSMYKFFRGMSDPHGAISELVNAGLWERVSDGYQLDWGDQERAETVRKRMETARLRQRRYREKSAEDRAQREASRNGVTDKRNGVTSRAPVRSGPVPPKGGIGQERTTAVASDGVAPGGAPALARPIALHQDNFAFINERDAEGKIIGMMAAAVPDDGHPCTEETAAEGLSALVDGMVARGYAVEPDRSLRSGRRAILIHGDDPAVLYAEALEVISGFVG